MALDPAGEVYLGKADTGAAVVLPQSKNSVDAWMENQARQDLYKAKEDNAADKEAEKKAAEARRRLYTIGSGEQFFQQELQGDATKLMDMYKAAEDPNRTQAERDNAFNDAEESRRLYQMKVDKSKKVMQEVRKADIDRAHNTDWYNTNEYEKAKMDWLYDGNSGSIRSLDQISDTPPVGMGRDSKIDLNANIARRDVSTITNTHPIKSSDGVIHNITVKKMDEKSEYQSFNSFWDEDSPDSRRLQSVLKQTNPNATEAEYKTAGWMMWKNAKQQRVDALNKESLQKDPGAGSTTQPKISGIDETKLYSGQKKNLDNDETKPTEFEGRDVIHFDKPVRVISATSKAFNQSTQGFENVEGGRNIAYQEVGAFPTLYKDVVVEKADGTQMTMRKGTVLSPAVAEKYPNAVKWEAYGIGLKSAVPDGSGGDVAQPLMYPWKDLAPNSRISEEDRKTIGDKLAKYGMDWKGQPLNNTTGTSKIKEWNAKWASLPKGASMIGLDGKKYTKK